MGAWPRPSRRTLLAGAAASLALPWLSRGVRAAAPAVSDDAWAKLARRITGGVVRPGDARFVALTQPENLRYDAAPPDPAAPLAAIQPHNAKEVADAILWARDAGCPMVPRSGGHSYAGCSTIGGLIIHGGAMRDVRYNPASTLVEVGGGALNGDVFAALRHRNRAIVHGRCGAVGVSAYLMGGGIGLAMREHGVGCDLVQSVELVLANGQKVRASATNEYRELFWALRGGGGGNLGLATRWWLHTVPADKVIAFNANWWSNDDKRAIFTRLVRALEASPPEMGAQLSVYATTLDSPLPNRISLFGQFRGPLDKFNTLLGSALDDAEQKLVLELPYWQAQEFFEIAAVPNRYQEVSVFADGLSDALIEQAFGALRQFPSAVAKARLTFFLTGGRINQTKPDATAFVHRSSQWLINPIVEWPENYDQSDRDLKWQRDTLDRFASMLGATGCYQNFSDPDLKDHAGAYWGSNLPRLSRIKHAVDPDGIFTPPRHQEIPQTA